MGRQKSSVYKTIKKKLFICLFVFFGNEFNQLKLFLLSFIIN